MFEGALTMMRWQQEERSMTRYDCFGFGVEKAYAAVFYVEDLKKERGGQVQSEAQQAVQPVDDILWLWCIYHQAISGGHGQCQWQWQWDFCYLRLLYNTYCDV